MLSLEEFLNTNNISIDGLDSSGETKKTEPAPRQESPSDLTSNRDFIRQVESTNNYNIGHHYALGTGKNGGRLSSAYGPYGFTDETYRGVQKLNPLFRDKSIDKLSKEEFDTAFDTLWESNKKYLQNKGIEATDANIRLAHFLGGPDAAYYLKTGKFSPNTISTYGSEKEAEMVAGAYKAKMPVKEYKRLYKEGKAPTAEQVVAKVNQPEPSEGTSTGSSFEWVDADTVIDNETGTRVRMAGINALESPKFDPEQGRFKQGDFGGQLQEEVLQKLAKDLGYTKLVYDPKQVDKYGRAQGGDLLNSKGESFNDYALSRGLVSPTEFTTAQQQNAFDIGSLERAKRKTEEPFDRFYLHSQGKYEYKDPGDYLYDLLTYQTSQVPLVAKPYATSAKQYGAAPEMYAGAGVVRPEENEMGFARSNWSTGLDSAMLQMRGGYVGALDMVSSLLNYDEGRNVAAARNLQVQNALEQLPILKSGEAFDARTGEWKIKSFGEALDFSIATAAQSAPDMLVSLIAFAAAAPTYGASLAIPVARYSGEVWNNQDKDNKNAGWAIAAGIVSTALDKFGIEGVAKSINGKEAIEKGIELLIKQKGLSREAAEKIVVQETKKVANQVINISKATMAGAGSEGLTESLQQIVQYLGSTQGEVKDTIELTNQVVNAFVGGAVLGGGMAGAGRTINLLTTNPTTTTLANDLTFREKQVNETGSVASIHDVIEESRNTNVNDDVNLDKQSAPEESKRKTSGLAQTVKNWWNDKGPKSLFGKWSEDIIKERGHRGKFMAAVSTILGANNALNGGDIYSNQDTIAGVIRDAFGNIGDIQKSFGGLKLSEINRILNNLDAIRYMVSFLQTPNNTPALPGELAKHANALKAVATKLDSALNRHNTILGKSGDTAIDATKFFSNKLFNKGFIASNRESFINDLSSTLGISKEQATKMYDMVINNQMEMSIEDMFDSPALSSQSLSHKIDTNDTQGIMNKYFHNNVFDNLFSFAQKTGAEYVNSKMLGKDGAILANLLHSALKAGEINSDEASFMAKEIKDFIKVRNGEYKQITNPLYNGVLNTITFFSTISSLPLAAISSIPEAAQVMRGLSKGQALTAYRRLLSNTAEEMYNLFKEIGTRQHNHSMTSRQMLTKFGFHTGETNVADRYDIHSGMYQKWTNSFFKLTGLQGYTNATRYARLSIAANAINNWLNTLIDADYAKLTQEQQDAYEHLVRLGVDPHQQNKQFNLNMNPDELALVQDNYNRTMERAVYNFVNEAVVHPNPLNRPKFYSDPYLKLFTLFQGYISTFTANVLPKLYGDLGKKGSADQRNAMATIASMIALTMLAVAIKDMIKYGEHPPKWLEGDNEKLLQRIIGATGLTGTGERVINFVHPLIEKKANNPAEKLYNILEGESPVLSYTAKVGAAINSAFDSEGTNTVKKVAKVAPIVGSINQLTDYLQENLGGR